MIFANTYRKVFKWAYAKNVRLSRAQRDVLSVLYQFKDKGWYGGYEQLAMIADCTRGTARKAVDILEQYGIITVQRCKGGNMRYNMINVVEAKVDEMRKFTEEAHAAAMEKIRKKINKAKDKEKIKEDIAALTIPKEMITKEKNDAPQRPTAEVALKRMNLLADNHPERLGRYTLSQMAQDYNKEDFYYKWMAARLKTITDVTEFKEIWIYDNDLHNALLERYGNMTCWDFVAFCEKFRHRDYGEPYGRSLQTCILDAIRIYQKGQPVTAAQYNARRAKEVAEAYERKLEMNKKSEANMDLVNDVVRRITHKAAPTIKKDTDKEAAPTLERKSLTQEMYERLGLSYTN